LKPVERPLKALELDSQLHREAIATLAKALEEITTMNFTPNEGFMLSRINGQWDLGSLIKISPIREPDAMLRSGNA